MRFKPHKNKDYIQLALEIGLFAAEEQLREDVLNRVKHFYICGAARKIRVDPAHLLRLSRKYKINFPKWNEITSWSGVMKSKAVLESQQNE